MDSRWFGEMRQPIKHEVYLTQFLEEYQLPPLTLYIGDGDPHFHTSRFLQETGLSAIAHDLLMRLFPVSLDSHAFEWYLTLPPCHVSSWPMLIDHFYH